MKNHVSVPSLPTIATSLVVVAACVAPIAIQHYLSISPAVMGAIGIPAIILLGFLGSVTVMVPIPVLSLVFAGAAILNPVVLVIAAAASITAGMAVCYVLGRRGHKQAIRVSERSRGHLPGPISRFYSWSTAHVGTASFLIAATPNPLFDYAGFIAGAGKFNVQRFLAGTFMGKVAQASVIAFFGHTLGERLFAIL
ncbi:MAG: VTT domain-containing protein [Chloroflexi bacterium]|nr:VTT domain-containing protein [Chloroflexota bacterium]